MDKTIGRLLLVSAMILASFPYPAKAQSETDLTATEDPLIIEFIPYVWAAGLSGEIATLPGLPPVSVDLSPTDVLENLDFAFMGVAVVRQGRFGLFSDIVYSDLSASASFPDVQFSPTASISASTLILTAGGLYRLIENDTGFLEVLAGGRYWDLETRLTLGAATLPSLTLASNKVWLDPALGARGRFNLNERFTLSATGLIAGSDGGSDLTTDFWITLGYEWNERFRTILGYRRLDVDYEDGDFLYDVTQDGAILGLNFSF